MEQSTTPTPSSAMAGFDDFVTAILPQLLALFAVSQAFLHQPPTPELAHAFEHSLNSSLQDIGRVLVEKTYNQIEPEQLADCPLRLRLAGQEYRRRPKSRNHIATLFGEIELRRYLYEATDRGEPAIFPLELHLGVEAGLATPALAERVGLWSAEHEQAQ